MKEAIWERRRRHFINKDERPIDYCTSATRYQSKCWQCNQHATQPLIRVDFYWRPCRELVRYRQFLPSRTRLHTEVPSRTNIPPQCVHILYLSFTSDEGSSVVIDTSRVIISLFVSNNYLHNLPLPTWRICFTTSI